MLYKLTVYLKKDDMLLPVHVYFSEEKEDLVRRARHHESFNDSYVSILITSKPVTAEIL